MTSGTLIREARLRAGMSQVELARRSGKDRAQLARWERDVVQPSFETLTTKAEIVKAVADAFAFCDDAFSSLTDASAAEMISNGRGGQQSRAAALLGVLAHGSEMYGIGTVYLRLKGQIPPSTELFMRGRGAPGGGRGGDGRGRQ